MHIPIDEAKTQLLELVHQAERGVDIVLTRDGLPIVRLVRMSVHPRLHQRQAIIDSIRESARSHRCTGPSSSQGQTMLYDENGLPQ